MSLLHTHCQWSCRAGGGATVCAAGGRRARGAACTFLSAVPCTFASKPVCLAAEYADTLARYRVEALPPRKRARIPKTDTCAYKYGESTSCYASWS